MLLCALLCFFAISILAGAQESAAEQDQQGQKLTPKGKTIKQPAPPLVHNRLFHKHRGMYKTPSGKEVIDATPQSPPLVVDDPSVPDKGQYEINLTNQADLAKPMDFYLFPLVDANYGIVPRIFGHDLPTQVKFEFPFAGAKPADSPMQTGIGATLFGLKFNFYDDEHRGLSLSFYPQIEFAIPGTGAAEKNLADHGETLVLPLLVSKELKYVTVVVNAGIGQPFGDWQRKTTGMLGFGAGRAITRQTALMGEIYGQSQFDFRNQRLLVANLGVMRHLWGPILIYGNVGRSIVSDDAPWHIYAGGGVKFLFTPRAADREKRELSGNVP